MAQLPDKLAGVNLLVAFVSFGIILAFILEAIVRFRPEFPLHLVLAGREAAVWSVHFEGVIFAV